MRIAALALLALAACTSVPAIEAPLTGAWGGTHVELQLEAGGGTLNYDCAHGTIGPVVPGSDGHFAGTGTHTPEHGGPVREGEVLPTYPATYAGTVRGDRMTLEGRLGNGTILGPFELTRDAQPQIFRCL